MTSKDTQLRNAALISWASQTAETETFVFQLPFCMLFMLPLHLYSLPQLLTKLMFSSFTTNFELIKPPCEHAAN